MALTQIDFDDAQENKIERLSRKWDLNKPKTVRKIIDEHLDKYKIICWQNIHIKMINKWVLRSLKYLIVLLIEMSSFMMYRLQSGGCLNWMNYFEKPNFLWG